MKKIVLLLVSLFFSAILFCQVNLGVGLMAYYPFNGNANDASGNNNNPVFNNATLTADRFGSPNSAYSFNGTGNYMRIPNSSSLNYGTQMSITAWVKVAGFYQGPCHGNSILMKGDAGGLTGNYLLFFDDNGFTGGQNCVNPIPDIQHQNFYGPNTPPPAGGYTPFVQTNQWYMVTYTSDGTTAKLYMNCELKLSFPANGYTFTNTYDLFLGRLNHPQFPYWFNGVMDEVRIYNRALTTDEVNALGGCNIVSGCIPTFQKLYGGNKADFAYHIEVNPDGSYVTAGSTNSFGNGGNDGYLQKMDKNGNILWSKTFGGAGNDYFNAIKPTTDGGYIVVGSTASFGGSSNGSAWVVKTDGNGNMQWSRRFDDGNVNGSILWDVVNTADGGYALSGTNRYAGGVANGMVIKTDNTGVIIWAKSFDSFNSDQSMGVIEDGNSLIVISLQYGQSSSFYDGVIMKLNTSDGSVTWARNYDIENKSNWPRELFKTSAGYSFSCYEDVGFSTIAPEQVVVNTDLNGNPLSLRKVNGSPTRFGYYVPTSDGGFITAQGGITDPNDDIHLVKVSSAGGVQWTSRFGGTGLQSAYDIAQSPDGGFLIAGINNGTPAVNDSANVYILKTDSLGNTPGCNPGTTTATVSTPAFTSNPAFVWAAVTNLSFSNTAITSSSTNPNPFTNTLCSSACQLTDTIINDYTGVLSFDKCTNILNVVDCAKFKNGDTVLLIQMKGAVIDSSNTTAFGAINNYKNAGNYEFNIVKNINGNLIELKNYLTRQYDLPDGKVQLIRVPYLQSASFNSRLTCLPWDGEKGGVVVLNVRDTVNLNANIDVSGKGFRGGNDPYSNPPFFNCNENNFFYPPNPDLASEKGESIAILSSSKSFGKGSIANGGGGGNSHNSGGGGGSNAAAGGFGGYNFEGSPCTNTPFDNRGIGGNLLTYNNTVNKIFLGGGGGAGHSNNPQAFEAKGGNGSGIVIIMADKLKANSNKIIANGDDGLGCGSTGVGCHEGMGGGGAGGTVLMKINTYLDNNSVEANGGKGADMTASGFLRVGPGGGGSGGILWLSNSSLPGAVTYLNNGGINGVATAYANSPFGATAGAIGNNLLNLQIPVGNTPFKSTFDSARLNIFVISCTQFRFLGLVNVDTLKVVKWQWNFGDGTIDSVQSVFHEYVSPGVYTVKLIATDIYGCVATFTVDMIIHCRCEEIRITSPNPATDVITVSGLGCGINTLILYNMLGQKIRVVSGDNSSETIPISNLPKAMYIIKVINKDKVVASLKVLKM